MKCDIVLAGVGGQGVLSIATVIGYAAVESGLYLKQAEVHGMSQRGGAVLSHLRISDKEIFSELVPEGGAHLILSAEPMESLRYLPYLSPGGWIVTNSTPYVNIPNYPDREALLAEIRKQPHYLYFDADTMAKEVGNPRGVNMVISGAASVFIDLPFKKMQEGIRMIFGKKSEDIINKNLEALKAGRKYAEENR
ncbi:MAG: indolepyruvate oxidoreductase subunit beta [Candidatus Aminicenantes bacterium]|nr:MAG: indolepyruvate oxidoreductase subunit beta [Candidatus Aminicenantes bacterium]